MMNMLLYLCFLNLCVLLSAQFAVVYFADEKLDIADLNILDFSYFKLVLCVADSILYNEYSTSNSNVNISLQKLEIVHTGNFAVNPHIECLASITDVAITAILINKIELINTQILPFINFAVNTPVELEVGCFTNDDSVEFIQMTDDLRVCNLSMLMLSPSLSHSLSNYNRLYYEQLVSKDVLQMATPGESSQLQYGPLFTVIQSYLRKYHHRVTLFPTILEVEPLSLPLDAFDSISIPQPFAQVTVPELKHENNYPVPRKVWDIFPYFDEFTLIRTRMHLLKDFVDYFVIIEAEYTHTGIASICI